ncbi:MAG: manganese transporter [Candidatus Melainabacteria bacterium RIFOXYA12_FULL_32_12]|nr:MAG: manganese transporter [Candidatus Melainabacteria bacterium RIFOXYA12_FULL_32_12]
MDLSFIQRALLAGLFIGFLASFYGVFVVQRQLSFLGSGLAHAAFGGVALGLLLGIEPLWIAIPFTILVAIGIISVQEKTGLTGDTAIGIFFSVSMALGVIFLSLKKGFAADAFTYLFGSILAVGIGDLWITGIFAIITIFMWRFWGKWSYATFEKDLAITDRIPVKRENYLLNVLIAIAVVVSIKVVGIVLIAAFLVIPAATARLLSKTFSIMTLYSIFIGILSTFIGLWLSYFLDLPSGPVIILIQASLFFGSILFKNQSI